jgi:uncharacterized membrane protein
MRALFRDDAGGRETARIEAFSDGVIAIAITLLVLDIRVPQHREETTLREQLVDLWPNYLGFLLSFLVIGIMWANHHEIFGFIAHSNRTLVLLNLLLLLCIGFIPFPTALLAEYLGHEGERTAVVVYAGVMMASAFSFNALWNYPRRAGLLDPDADPVGIANIARAFRMGPLLYTIAFGLAFFTTWPTLVLLGLLALSYLVPPSWFGAARSGGKPGS